MKISVEISKHPLSADYLERVDDFLERLYQNPQIKVVTNNISTQVFGEASVVFSVLEKEITTSFEKFGQSPFVLKILSGDLSELPIKDYHG
jgi:hypothetical protein